MKLMNRNKLATGGQKAPMAGDGDRFSLDKMQLDRGDQGGGNDTYDPFYKVNV